MSGSLPCSSESSLQGINTGEATSSTSHHLDILPEPTDNLLEEKAPCPTTIFPEIEGKYKVLEKIGEGKGQTKTLLTERDLQLGVQRDGNEWSGRSGLEETSWNLCTLSYLQRN